MLLFLAVWSLDDHNARKKLKCEHKADYDLTVSARMARLSRSP